MVDFIPGLSTSTPQWSIGVQVHGDVIQIIILKNGHPVPEGVVALNEEQAVQHVMGLVRAIELMRGSGKSKLILPSMIGGRPFMP